MPFCRQAGLFVYPTLACPGSAQDRCKSHGRAPSGDSLHVSERLHVCHFTSLLQDEVCNTMKTRNAVFGHVSLEQGRGLMGEVGDDASPVRHHQVHRDFPLWKISGNV